MMFLFTCIAIGVILNPIALVAMPPGLCVVRAAVKS
jgi:hypothetical protein